MLLAASVAFRLVHTECGSRIRSERNVGQFPRKQFPFLSVKNRDLTRFPAEDARLCRVRRFEVALL
jgi:hypothetical protein